MSAPDRCEFIDRQQHGRLSIRRQCELLGVARSGIYRPRPAANDNDFGLTWRIDEVFTAWPLSWLAADDRDAARAGMCRQSQADAATDATGDCSARAEAAHQQASARAQDIPVLLRELAIQWSNQVLVRGHQLVDRL
jgi:hypothetical protein